MRQAVRMLVATGIAYGVTRALHLHSGYWAMITVMIVVQGNLGGTLDAGFTQLSGTLLGGLGGMAGVLLRTHHLLPNDVILLLVLTPLALISASEPHFRTGPVTALIVLLVTPTSGSSIDLALGRIGEIGIGSVIGILTSILLLPGRAHAGLIQQVADALRALGALSQALLTGRRDTDGLNAAVNRALAQAEAAHEAFRHERAIRLAEASPVDVLLRSVRRVRTDVAMLGRAVAVADAGAAALSAPLHDWLGDAAAAVRGRGRTPSLDWVSRCGRELAPDGPLRFCLDVLQRDLAELAVRINALAR